MSFDVITSPLQRLSDLKTDPGVVSPDVVLASWWGIMDSYRSSV
jgi:hypothetical protein